MEVSSESSKSEQVSIKPLDASTFQNSTLMPISAKSQIEIKADISSLTKTIYQKKLEI